MSAVAAEILQQLGGPAGLATFGDYLSSRAKRPYAFKGKAVSSAHGVVVKFLGKKPKDALVTPAFFLDIKYAKGSDTYKVQAGFMSAGGEVERKVDYADIFADQLAEPQTFFNWVGAQREAEATSGPPLAELMTLMTTMDMMNSKAAAKPGRTKPETTKTAPVKGKQPKKPGLLSALKRMMGTKESTTMDNSLNSLITEARSLLERCENGTHKDRKTGKCEPVKGAHPKANAAKSPSVADQAQGGGMPSSGVVSASGPDKGDSGNHPMAPAGFVHKMSDGTVLSGKALKAKTAEFRDAWHKEYKRGETAHIKADEYKAKASEAYNKGRYKQGDKFSQLHKKHRDQAEVHYRGADAVHRELTTFNPWAFQGD